MKWINYLIYLMKAILNYCRTTSAQVTLEEANAMLAEFDNHDIVMETDTQGNLRFFSFYLLRIKDSTFLVETD